MFSYLSLRRFQSLNQKTVKLFVSSLIDNSFFPYSAHSSSNCEVDLIGGDSGFQELNTYSTKMDKAWPSAFTQEPCKSSVESTSETKVESKEKSAAAFLKADEMKENMHEDKSPTSDLSCDSCWSDMSEESWKPVGPIDWIYQQITQGTNPKTLLSTMLPNTVIPSHVDPLILWKILFHVLSQPPQRPKLPHINLIEDVINLIQKSSKIIGKLQSLNHLNSRRKKSLKQHHFF